MLEQIMAHHDYVWARVPFLAPMAAAVARRREVARDVASRIAGLGSLLLRHLDEEERFFVARDAASATTWVGTGMLGDHLMIATALDEVLDAVARWNGPGTVLERRLEDELSALAEHVHAQMALEETLVTSRLPSASV